MVSVSVKKGGHTEHWPWAVEILYQQEAIHASMATLKDQTTLIESISRQEGVPTRVYTHTPQCSHLNFSLVMYIYVVYIHVCPLL